MKLTPEERESLFFAKDVLLVKRRNYNQKMQAMHNHDYSYMYMESLRDRLQHSIELINRLLEEENQ